MPSYTAAMKLRIDGLADIDPLAVPLPNGTEVTTRVDMMVGERKVPAGATGRVSNSDGDRVSVRLVGIGEATYVRDQLVPARAGQLRFARYRHAAWSALRDTCIVETVVGSRAWGLADEGSDTDVRGVFVLPFSWTIGLVDAPGDLVSTDGSATFWELGKAARQAIKADPNTLETLFVASATPCDELGEWLLAERDAFASTEIYGSFGRYALSQLNRLRQSARLAHHRGLMLDWLRDDDQLDLDRLADKLAHATDIEAASAAQAVLQAKQYIKQLYGSMFDQGLLAQRDFVSLARFARERAHEFELPRQLRPKNAYNLLRLIATAEGWLRTGSPEFCVSEPLSSELRAIKTGQVELSSVLDRAEDMSASLEDARKASPLPAHPDVARIDALLRRMRTEVARRWHDRVPGPFGADAPELPLAAWD